MNKTLIVIASLSMLIFNAFGQLAKDNSYIPSLRLDTVEKLKQRWKSQVNVYTNDFRVLYREQLEVLESLLANTSSNVVKQLHQRICSAEVPAIIEVPSDLDQNFDTVLLEAFTDLSIEQTNGQRLLEILKQNCPLYIALVPLEYSLASRWSDSITLLLDAYAGSRSLRCKHDIILCLGRAFPSMRQRYKNDATFVEKIKQWYQKNRSKVTVNGDYPNLPSSSPKSAFTNRELFKF